MRILNKIGAVLSATFLTSTVLATEASAQSVQVQPAGYYNLDITKGKISTGTLIGGGYNIPENAGNFGTFGYVQAEVAKLARKDISVGAGVYGSLNTIGNDRGAYSLVISQKTGLYGIFLWNSLDKKPAYIGVGKIFALGAKKGPVSHSAWAEAGLIPQR